MTLVLTRFWFEFDINGSPEARVMPWVGVTAWTSDDARHLVSEACFSGLELPPVTRLVEDVDIEDLDRGHVIPNMEPPHLRGVWYPRGFSLLR